MNNDDQMDSAHGAFARYIDESIGAEKLKHIIPPDQIDLASGPSYTGITIRLSPNVVQRLRNIDPEVRAKIEMIDRAKSSLGIRTAFMMPSIDSEQWYAQLEQQFRERIQYTYGDKFVEEADEFARTQGVSFASAVSALQLRDMVARSGEAMREVFERMQAFIASPEVQTVLRSITDTMQQVRARIDDSAVDVPVNRRERRAAKHSKPMKDADQQWKQRDFRNRRKH